MNTRINGHRVITNEEGITEVMCTREDSVAHIHATLYAVFALDIQEAKVVIDSFSYSVHKQQCRDYLQWEDVYKSMYDAVSTGATLEEWAVEKDIDLVALEHVAGVGTDWEKCYMDDYRRYKIQQYTACLKAHGIDWDRERYHL